MRATSMRSLLLPCESWQVVQLSPVLSEDLTTLASNITDVPRLTDFVASSLSTISTGTRQDLLATAEIRARLDKLNRILTKELEVLELGSKIQSQVQSEVGKGQREYFLREQMKAIQRELGEGDDQAREVDELREKIDAAGMPDEVRKEAMRELERLSKIPAAAAEYTVARTYIDWLVALPWNRQTEEVIDLRKTKDVLDADHSGLERLKDRILEYLAVRKLQPDVKGPILCFVGPPGVGKTSLGQSIARATNRKFMRMSLGGVRDEAEIRGHRRTYIGSMPGKILQNMSKVGVRNPLFLLDEVDKMGMDFRGDPSSALLEVLDPEQNHTFVDHYVEVEYDLSDVMFVATANTLNIPAPLLDRMEVIRLSGYTENEKVHIAKEYLLPKQLKANGLKAGELAVTDSALRDIARYYTREAGVRSFDRALAKICRKVVKSILIRKKDGATVTVNAKNLDKYLGVRKYTYGIAEKENQVGQVTGLAWTEVGGELLTVEAAKLPGKGNTVTTGKLGEVMQESIKAAISVVRARAKRLGIAEDFHQNMDLHIHLPEGATPKDGPSAGIAITTALVSVLTGIPVRCDVAMTGEITLRGEVLPIGGLKEKLLAAHRGGVKTVLIPHENVKDLAEELPEEVKGQIEILPVRWIDEVLERALETRPVPVAEAAPASPPPAAPAPAGESLVVKH